VGGESGASHASEGRGLQLLEQGIDTRQGAGERIARVQELLDGLVPGLAPIRVDLPGQGGPVGPLMGQRFLGDRRMDPAAQMLFSQVVIDVIVNRYSRRVIALAEAGDALDEEGPAARVDLVGQGLHPFPQRLGASKVTGDVPADEDFDLGASIELIMREKAGDLVQSVERHAGPFGAGPKFLGGQVAKPLLDRVEFLDDHRVPPSS